MQRPRVILPAAPGGPPVARPRRRPTLKEFINKVTAGTYQWEPHLDLLCVQLQLIADDLMPEDQVLMHLPPGFGKSLLGAQLFPAYYLRCHPDRYVFVGTNGRTLSLEHSREIRKYFKLSGGRLSDQGARAERWKTIQGGGLFATSPGAAILGWHYHLLVVDDPFDREKEAMTLSKQEAVEKWWKELDRRRMRWAGRGRRVARVCRLLIHQRLAVGDLAGRILREERKLRAGLRVVYIPGLQPEKGENTPSWPKTARVIELEGVEPGESTAPGFQTTEDLKAERKKDPLTFDAVYQQNPRIGGAGDYFSREDLRYWPFDWPALDELRGGTPMTMDRVIRSWDFGYSLDGDWTAGVKALRYRLGDDDASAHLRAEYGIRSKFVILVVDIVRRRVTPRTLDKLVIETIKMDGRHVELSLAQDPAAGAKAVEDTKKEIRDQLSPHGLVPSRIHLIESKTGKMERSRLFRRAAGHGIVFVMSGNSWAGQFIEELEGFTGGSQSGHDDLVDASSDAVSVLARGAKKLTW